MNKKELLKTRNKKEKSRFFCLILEIRKQKKR